VKDDVPSTQWERYGRAMISAMAEVLDSRDLEEATVLLETADWWLSLGLTIGLNRPEDAAELLTAIEAHEGDRVELAEDGATFCREVMA
jgi:hypothetical protein